jgi:monoamine oxidase
MFQPVGGMDMIADAFRREVGDLIRFHAKVTAIHQNERGVTVHYVTGGDRREAHADWSVCTIPLSILRQLDLAVSAPMAAAINAVPYVPATKIGLQMERRFWEEDEEIYGGITQTDLPIRRIGYPCSGFGKAGKGVLLGAYAVSDTPAFDFGALSPAERIAKALEWGALLHPQYKDEFDNGMAVSWQSIHRRSVASAIGATMPGACITGTSALLTAAWSWPASMPRIFRPGRRGRSFRHSTRLNGYIAVCSRVEHIYSNATQIL